MHLITTEKKFNLLIISDANHSHADPHDFMQPLGRVFLGVTAQVNASCRFNKVIKGIQNSFMVFNCIMQFPA